MLEDDDRRVALAAAGRGYVLRFDWDRTAELLEAFLERYVAEPAFVRARGPAGLTRIRAALAAARQRHRHRLRRP